MKKIAITLAILFFATAPSTEIENPEYNTSLSTTNITTTQATEPLTDQITVPTTEPITTVTEPIAVPTTTSAQIKETEPISETNTTKPTNKPVVKPTEPTAVPTTKPTEPATEPSKPSHPTTEPSKDNSQSNSDCDYVVNTNSKKFHYPSCSSVKKMNDENRWDYTGSRDALIEDGYEPCGRCHP